MTPYIPSHVYFRVLNQANEKQHFLANEAYVPHFRYGHHLKKSALTRQLSVLPETAIQQRDTLNLALLGAALQEHPTPKLVRDFRTMNAHLFGEPNRDYTDAIFARVSLRVRPDTQKLWDEVCGMIDVPIKNKKIFGPPEDVFLKYRDYFMTYTNGAFVENESITLLTSLHKLTKKLKLSDAGWRVKENDDASHARVNQREKVVSVGRHYSMRRPNSSLRIAVHEIYGHALRGPQSSIAESEGFAILLEQLMDDHFGMKRSHRYLAAALGWGVLGKPMAFREVFDILWRVMAIFSRYDIQKAQQHAFDECTRVFRGGRPEVAGAVYLKDSVYFSANIMMWEKLVEHDLSYNEFVDVIEGRRRVLG